MDTRLQGHLVFNGNSRVLKMFIKGGAAFGKPDGLLHTIECHDVGVNDGLLPDQYGDKCKCPPGDYTVGEPMACATRNPDGSVTSHNPNDAAYGCWFIPLSDVAPNGPLAQHQREGVGIHGGGSSLPNPFAPRQGWLVTYGCLRCQNEDLENVLVPFVRFIQQHAGQLTLTVVQP